MRAVSWWKVLGLAGVAGVAATGAVVARDQRRRSRLGPDEVRSRLHQRLAEAEADAGAGTGSGAGGTVGGDS